MKQTDLPQRKFEMDQAVWAEIGDELVHCKVIGWRDGTALTRKQGGPFNNWDYWLRRMGTDGVLTDRIWVRESLLSSMSEEKHPAVERSQEVQ